MFRPSEKRMFSLIGKCSGYIITKADSKQYKQQYLFNNMCVCVG